MKVLVDGCLPRYLKRVLVNHEVQTVQDAGWSGVKNGELLRLAETRFDVLLTAARNLRYQQNLAGRVISIIELPTNTLSVVKKLTPELLRGLDGIDRGAYLQIRMPV